MIIDSAKEYARLACLSADNVFGPRFFDQHLQVVADYGKRLAGIFKADAEIVELAAYLHDISAVIDISTLADHAAAGSRMAGEWLEHQGYPREKAQEVVRCITSHLSPIMPGKGSAEEVCVSNADAISQIVRPTYWHFFVFSIRKLDFDKGAEWLNSRVKANWQALHPEAQGLIAEEYALVQKVLGLANREGV